MFSNRPLFFPDDHPPAGPYQQTNRVTVKPRVESNPDTQVTKAQRAGDGQYNAFLASGRVVGICGRPHARAWKEPPLSVRIMLLSSMFSQ